MRLMPSNAMKGDLEINYDALISILEPSVRARQQTYPLQQIQDLSGIYRGFQMQPSTYKTAATYQAPPSLGQQLLGAGSVAAGIAAGLGKPLFGAAEGGLVGLAKGGMVEKYQYGGELVSPDDLFEEEFKEKYGKYG